MKPIELKRRYPNSRDEDITDAFMRGYQSAKGELVRCKDCEYKSLYDDGETKYYYCALEDRPNRQWSVDDDDFCSWAKMKGGNDD